ncbi:MAG: hypothetical protein LBL96_01190 [Clostridiales bacterium]|nr:hypothetical protein [Clostridiales bacterium]
MNNELLKAMSRDMNIPRFRNESDAAFTCRLCYSALGQWCLNTGRNKTGIKKGTTKHNQTIVLNELLERYTGLFPFVSDYFVDTSSQPRNISVFIRRTYEETGHLLTDENNHNKLTNFGRCMPLGKDTLFFGLPNEVYTVNGLGVFSSSTSYAVDVKDFLIRDDLTCEEYFKAQFDPIDFYERDIELHELEFFNPLVKSVLSKSWNKNLETDCSVARRFETGPFYRVMKTPNGIRFADETVESQSDNFTSYEYRRLYFAMKNHYGNPIRVWITKLDEEHSKIRVGGHLPNREYYLLLLLSWPERSAFDKANFIIKNRILAEVLAVLKNIGLEAKGGRIHE